MTLPQKNQECNGCGIETDTTPFGNPNSTRTLWLCADCTDKERAANSVLIDATKLISESRAVDSSIRYSGDIFNAETVSIAELRQVIEEDTAIPPSEKLPTLHKLVTERLELYKSRILQIDQEKHELVAKQQAGFLFMREFAGSIRAEIQERIKRADTSYIEQNPIRIPKEIKSRVSPMEKLVQQYSIMHNCSLDDARAFLRSNKQPTLIDPTDATEKLIGLMAVQLGVSLDEAREIVKKKQLENQS